MAAKKPRKPSPFDYIKSVSSSIENEVTSGKLSKADINRFMLTRGLGMFPDTIFEAEQANRLMFTSDEMVYNFLHSSVKPKKNRFTKWPKFKQDVPENEILEYMEQHEVGRIDAVENIRLESSIG